MREAISDTFIGFNTFFSKAKKISGKEVNLQELVPAERIARATSIDDWTCAIT